MGNYRPQLKLHRCPELSVNSLKSKVTADPFPIKKRLRGQNVSEANYYPSIPTGQSPESHEKEGLELLKEVGERNNEKTIWDKMAGGGEQATQD